jgi:hydrogenase maturation factor
MVAPVCGCATCADEATPMRVLSLDGERGLALCEAPNGQHRSVEVALIEPPIEGDTVLVHAGVAIAIGGAA